MPSHQNWQGKLEGRVWLLDLEWKWAQCCQHLSRLLGQLQGQLFDRWMGCRGGRSEFPSHPKWCRPTCNKYIWNDIAMDRASFLNILGKGTKSRRKLLWTKVLAGLFSLIDCLFVNALVRIHFGEIAGECRVSRKGKPPQIWVDFQVSVLTLVPEGLSSESADHQLSSMILQCQRPMEDVFIPSKSPSWPL